MGDLTNVDSFWSGTVDDLAAAFRLHRISGAGYEENISLIAYNKGYYHLHAGSDGPSQLPVFIGSGWDSNGVTKKAITVSGDGITSIGGKFGTSALEVGYRQEIDGESNRFRVDSGKGGSGSGPTLSAKGPDANITMSLRPKGIGEVSIGSKTQVNGVLYPAADNKFSVGTPQNRWSSIYAAVGTISTSDAKQKTDLKGLTQQEISASQELALGVGTFQWLKDCRDMGDQAGINVGYTAQHVVEVMTKHGLDWRRYSMVDYSEESDTFGLNYDQIIVFVMAGIVSKLASK